MAEIGEMVAAKVVEVVPLERVRPGVTRGGWCRVECRANGWQDEYLLVTGSVQGIPIEDQIIGREGRLRWAHAFGYFGPVWVREMTDATT